MSLMIGDQRKPKQEELLNGFAFHEYFSNPVDYRIYLQNLLDELEND
jgi:hypothetical protein